MAHFIPNKKALDTMINFAKNIEIQVGIVEPQIREDGLDMAYIQARNYYGSIEENLPSRDPYITPTNNKKDVINTRIRIFQALNGEKVNETKFANVVGEAVLQEAVLETFRTSEGLTPNALLTIALKGSDKPLIDTGELMKAQAYKVVKK
jgi:hypothetical protein